MADEEAIHTLANPSFLPRQETRGLLLFRFHIIPSIIIIIITIDNSIFFFLVS